MREQAMATAVDLFERDERVALVMADISLDYLRTLRIPALWRQEIQLIPGADLG